MFWTKQNSFNIFWECIILMDFLNLKIPHKFRIVIIQQYLIKNSYYSVVFYLIKVAE